MLLARLSPDTGRSYARVRRVYAAVCATPRHSTHAGAVHSSQWTKGRSLNMASHVFVHVNRKLPIVYCLLYVQFLCVCVCVCVCQWRTWHTSSGGASSGIDPFFGWGGGVKVRKMPNFSARLARKVPISNFSRKARRKNENYVCLVVFLC